MSPQHAAALGVNADDAAKTSMQRPELDTFLDGLEQATLEARTLADAVAAALPNAAVPSANTRGDASPRRDTWAARVEREKAEKAEKRQRGKEGETRALLGDWHEEFRREARVAAAQEVRRSTAERIEASGRPRIMELELERVLEPLGGLGAAALDSSAPGTPRSQVGTPRTRAPSPPLTPRGWRAQSPPPSPRGAGGGATTAAREPMRALPPKLDRGW